MYRWRVDLTNATAEIVDQQQRRVGSPDKRLNVKPIAESLANAIVNNLPDERLRTMKDGRVRLVIADIIPETIKETTMKRRRRLRAALDELLAEHGWHPTAVNTYARDRGT